MHPRAGPLSRIPPWALFGFVCLAWGSSWVPSKIAVGLLPPMPLAALRSLLVCALMLALCDWRQLGVAWRREPLRLLSAALLCTTFTHIPLYWGQQYLPSGLTGLINYGLTPLAFFVLSAAVGEQRFSLVRASGVALGLVGLALMSMGDLHIATMPPVGLAAVVAGTLAFCWGTVLVRPLLSGPQRVDPAAMNALQMGIGGVASLAVAACDPAPWPAWRTLLHPQLWAALAFLVLVSGGAATLAYWRLVRDWGSLRAGAFSLVCPLVAVAQGALLLGERLTARQGLGCALMLLAAAWIQWMPGLRLRRGAG